MLCTSFNVVGFNWIASPTATELESIVIKCIPSSKRCPRSLESSRPISTNSPHQLPLDLAMSPDVVHMAMKDDVASGMVPMYLCATCLWQKKNGVWLHVDAAYAGSTYIYPEFRHYLDRVELADSISFNAHKWLLTNMDCCCLWIKSPSSPQNSLSNNAEFLSNNASETKGAVIDYKDWQISLSRRFRAMKLWVVICRFGVASLRDHVRSGIMMAEHFKGLVGVDPGLEVVVPRRFSLVCFRHKPKVKAMGMS
ncbi:tyrosine/DOPA decarboxylase 1-like protein [Cinnamomum micranthum f. kanehirae]|uniref:Tyrosine/DOPA decarboxylase 1-like protein n=1 Tax=Cinnamomum micranthum f. kanehirae TaxID=337451 RepID=A0A3S3PHU9_9MAGN|nr:tyrosine/DOPA decarboxylase 1-like protein [Cinnamomum micranthum f. kanehirae]